MLGDRTWANPVSLMAWLVMSQLSGLECVVCVGLAMIVCCAAGACPLVSPAVAEGLPDALGAAYAYNPRLDAQRALLRASDEDVARAMSGDRTRKVAS